ncbi:protein of unknown function [Paraburkholderia kururiensis]
MMGACGPVLRAVTQAKGETVRGPPVAGWNVGGAIGNWKQVSVFGSAAVVLECSRRC